MEPKIRKYLIISLCLLLLTMGGTIVVKKIICNSFADVHNVTDPLGHVDSRRVDSGISGFGDSISVAEAGIVESRDELRAVGDHITESRESVARAETALKRAETGLATSEKGLADLKQQMKDLEQSFNDYKVLVIKAQRREKVLRVFLLLGLVATGIWAAVK